MSFGMIKSNQNIKKKRNYVTWMQTTLQSRYKQKTFTYSFQKMF